MGKVDKMWRIWHVRSHSASTGLMITNIGSVLPHQTRLVVEQCFKVIVAGSSSALPRRSSPVLCARSTYPTALVNDVIWDCESQRRRQLRKLLCCSASQSVACVEYLLSARIGDAEMLE